MEIGGIVMKDISKFETPVEPEIKKVDAEEKILEKAITEVSKVESLKDYMVICARLNVRRSASDSADILRTIKSGDKVKVDKAHSIGAWSKITTPVEGFVLSKFIAPVK